MAGDHPSPSNGFDPGGVSSRVKSATNGSNGLDHIVVAAAPNEASTGQGSTSTPPNLTPAKTDNDADDDHCDDEPSIFPARASPSTRRALYCRDNTIATIQRLGSFSVSSPQEDQVGFDGGGFPGCKEASPSKPTVEGKAAEAAGVPQPGCGRQDPSDPNKRPFGQLRCSLGSWLTSRTRTSLLFERAAPSSSWNPRFDSAILEKQYWTSTFPRTTKRFQFGLVYLILVGLCLAAYFPAMKTTSWPLFLGASLAVVAVSLGVLLFTTSPAYEGHCFKVSVVLSVALCSISLLATANLSEDAHSIYVKDLSPSGLFVNYVELLLLIYTVIPLPLYGTLIIGLTYSLVFETVLCLALPHRTAHLSTIFVNVLVHICIHSLGVHILLTTQVRMRDTFMKVGQSLIVKKQLVAEKGIKEKMIHSVMPPKVADWLMKEGHTEDVDDPVVGGGPVAPSAGPGAAMGGLGGALGGRKRGAGQHDKRQRKKSFFDGNDDWSSFEGSESSLMARKVSSPRSSNQGDIRTIFRPFNMNAMDNVSILFADIVGFTKMSSNKTASQLVGLLNDLFGRFDYLCAKCGCEKISTLGDCYYCVSGCPEPVPNHARNCVEMGLAMIKAIREFDEDRNESVNMRVGIHTGTVLCGIVGKRRFKFDVWSNDVTFANKMESTGKPGMVHISEKTYAFLKDQYFVQEGEPVSGVKTYFISGRATSFDGDGYDSSSVDASAPRYIEDVSSNVIASCMSKDQLQGIALETSKAVRGQTAPPLVSIASGSQRNARSAEPELKMFNNGSGDQGGCSSGGANDQVDNNGKAGKQSKSRSLFSLANRTYAMMSTSKAKRGVDLQQVGSDGNDISMLQPGNDKNHLSTHVSMVDEGRYSTILSRRYSYSLPSLKSGKELAGNFLRPNHPGGHKNNLASSLLMSQNRSGSSASPPTICCARQPDLETGVASFAVDTDEASRAIVGRVSAAASSAADEPIKKLAIMRLRSDQAMIRCIKDDASHHNYFTRPPLRPATLFFSNPHVENVYRRTAWRGRGERPTTTTASGLVVDAIEEQRMDRNNHQLDGQHHQPQQPEQQQQQQSTRPMSWSPSSFSAVFDLLVSLVTFLIVSLAAFLHYPTETWSVAYFALALAFEAVVLYVFGRQMYLQKRHVFRRRSGLQKLYSWARGWVPSHVFGVTLASLPLLATLVNFSCGEVQGSERTFFLQLVCVGLVHFCNFSALNYMAKSVVASSGAAVAVLLLYSPLACPGGPRPFGRLGSSSSVGCFSAPNLSKVVVPLNFTYAEAGGPAVADQGAVLPVFDVGNVTWCGGGTNSEGDSTAGAMFAESVLSLVTLAALVWVLNREFEIAYRISFHCSLLSAQDRRKVQNMKNQADWLLHNIIPKHVSDSLKRSACYSENHREVGIIFASLVNFNELYDESYMGGKEYLRVLNELISDFDEILDRPEFANVEKIKTIGSTFMGASGMNPYIRQENLHKYQHLHELLEFVLELQRSVFEFNQSLIEFDLVLRVGLNFGDVTAGVIGTTKLYYDIWGDAVNIASRMDSTGVEGRVQVSEASMHALSEWYNFEFRGSIFVKGKDNMTTYLLVGRKPPVPGAVTSSM